jgi:hypothetical protein
MGIGIFVWVERRLPSGAWSMVKRREDRQPSWRHEEEWERENHEGQEWARAKLLQVRALADPPAWDVAYLERKAAGGLTGPHHDWDIAFRNYNLFAIIAGHCNYIGTTHVIAPPRGIPPDLSDEVLGDLDEMFFFYGKTTRAERLDSLKRDNVVAPSWVTVEELLAVDWEVATSGKGVEDFLSILREELVPIGPPEQVRLVFFFDS